MLVYVYNHHDIRLVPEREERGGMRSNTFRNPSKHWSRFLNVCVERQAEHGSCFLADTEPRSIQSSWGLWKDFTHHSNTIGVRSVVWQMYRTNSSSSFKSKHCQGSVRGGRNRTSETNFRRLTCSRKQNRVNLRKPQAKRVVRHSKVVWAFWTFWDVWPFLLPVWSGLKEKESLGSQWKENFSKLKSRRSRWHQ